MWLIGFKEVLGSSSNLFQINTRLPTHFKNAHGRHKGNRPFPSSFLPLFQNESWCKTFHIKNEFYSHVHFHANQTHFHLNGFA